MQLTTIMRPHLKPLTRVLAAPAVLMCLSSIKAQAAEFCVSNATEFQAAISTAATNGQADEIRLVFGEYIGNFIFATVSESYGLSVRGGFQSGCIEQTGVPADTVLDGALADTVIAFSVDTFVEADFTLERLTVRNGQRDSGDGGGAYVDTGGAIRISDVHFENNSAEGHGGALYVDLGASALTIERSVFRGNSSGSWGGAVRVFSARNLRIIDNIFAENHSYLSAGAIQIRQSSSSSADVVSGNTFVFNSIEASCSSCGGGAIEAYLRNESAHFYLENNVFFANSAANWPDFWLQNDPDEDFIASPLSVRGNAWDHSGGVPEWDRPPSVLERNVDTTLARFTDEFGGDFRPAPGSPLIDRGVSGYVASGAADLTGSERLQGPRIDIGALEATPLLTLAIRPVGPASTAVVSWNEQVSAFTAQSINVPTGEIHADSPLLSDSILRLAALSTASPALAALGITSDGSPRVQVRDGDSGAFIRSQAFFDKTWNPLGLAVIPDLGGDGSEELAVLAEGLATGEIAVQIRDAASGAFVKNVFFLNPNWTAEALLEFGEIDTNAGPELGVLGTSSAGQIVVMVKDAGTNTFIRNVFFLNSNWRPVKALVLEDFSGNMANEVALLAQNRQSGQLVVMTKDAATNTFLNNIFPLGSAWEPITAVVLPDENSNGSQELAVLASQKDTGVLVIQVRDPMSGQHLRDMTVLGASWDPRDMIVLPDIGGGIPGLSVLATRKTDDLPVVQTIEATSGDLVSNVFLN